MTEDYRDIEEAMARQIPRRVVDMPEEVWSDNRKMIFYHKCCPVCENIAVGDYCWHCGQRLYWGEEE